MNIPLPGGRGIGGPAVGDHVTVWLDAGLQESSKADGAGLRDQDQASTAETALPELHGTGQQHLPQRPAARDARLRAAKVRLVDLHVPTQPVASGMHHHRTVAVEKHPGGLDRAQTHLQMHLDCRYTDLVADHPPGDRQLDRQRDPGLIEDRSSGRGDLAVAATAFPPRIRQPPTLAACAVRTHESVGPT